MADVVAAVAAVTEAAIAAAAAVAIVRAALTVANAVLTAASKLSLLAQIRSWRFARAALTHGLSSQRHCSSHPSTPYL